MPYNNTPIPPPADISGAVSLPLARVKKIIGADEDINNCSANAAFAIAVATEQFVYYLTEQAFKMAKAEKKPKRQLTYAHVNAAVSRHDNLEFLTDVVPRQVSFKEAKQIRAKKASTTAAAAAPPAAAAAPPGPANGAGPAATPTPAVAGTPAQNGHAASTAAPPAAAAEAEDEDMQVDEDAGTPA